MWTEEKLNEAAEEYCKRTFAGKIGGQFEIDMRNIFLAGCKYIINNTQKDNEDKVRKEDNDYSA